MKIRHLVMGIMLGVCAAGGLAGQSSLPAAVQKSPPRAVLPRLGKHPVVALTFDDLPAAGSLPQGQSRAQILTTLAAELKANHLTGVYGFVNAVNMENYPDAQKALRIWVDAGMKIGNH